MSKFVEITENDVQQKKIDEKAANEILKENYVPNDKNTYQFVNKEEPIGVDTEDDLPF